jgi:glycosyltransferase involved in cell wall biosynthesis
MGAIVARHAVPGDDVEAILRALWDPDPELRDEAYADGLVATIWHQGTVYEATAFAVPFLAAFATDPALPSRGNVLSALVLIARSASQGNAEDPIITNKALEALRASRHFLEQLASGEPAVAAETGRTLLRVVDGDEGALEDAEDLLDGLNGWANAEEEEAAADEEE